MDDDSSVSAAVFDKHSLDFVSAEGDLFSLNLLIQHGVWSCILQRVSVKLEVQLQIKSCPISFVLNVLALFLVIVQLHLGIFVNLQLRL